MNRKSVLIIDGDEGPREEVRARLDAAGFETLTAADAVAGTASVDEFGPSIILADAKLPGESSPWLLREVRQRHPGVTVILIAASDAVNAAVEAENSGASYDYVTKPIDYDNLLVVLERALERRDLLDPVLNLRSALDVNPGFPSIIGRSKSLLRILNMALRAARTDSVVLISGETGTGKELLAQAVHLNSRRKDQPFVVINCGAIPRDLMESELFGHLKGAFTGAVADKRGRVETADGGTLFFDEIGELPLELQVKLLRLIQQGEIEKLGATGSSRVNVRIVAATNRNLRAMVGLGTFREDLYYRLAVIPLELPPLRARTEDMPELTRYLFDRIRQKHGRPELRMSASVIPCLAGHDWPGNIRELENVIERMIVLTVGPEVTREDLPESIERRPAAVTGIRLELPSERLSLEGVEKEIIVRALKKFFWNQTHAAQYLNISRRTLIYRMEKYGLKTDRERPSRSAPGPTVP
jgi:DNA-binding NtrC family response regulator